MVCNSAGVGTGSIYWILYDQEGSIRDIINLSWTAVGHQDFDAFPGVVNETAFPLDVAFAFTGKMWDADVNLYYYSRAPRKTPNAPRSSSASVRPHSAHATPPFRCVFRGCHLS